VLRGIVGLSTVLALMGSPSVVAACAALCAPGAESVHHGRHNSTPEPAVEPSHAHHQALPALAEPTPEEQSPVGVEALGCCSHEFRASSSATRVLRTADEGRFLAVASVRMKASDAAASLRGRDSGHAVPPPPPPRAPLVLLI
jgi:hypothetical protein